MKPTQYSRQGDSDSLSDEMKPSHNQVDKLSVTAYLVKSELQKDIEKVIADKLNIHDGYHYMGVLETTDRIMQLISETMSAVIRNVDMPLKRYEVQGYQNAQVKAKDKVLAAVEDYFAFKTTTEVTDLVATDKESK